MNQAKGVSCAPQSLAQADPVGANQAATTIVRNEFNNKGYPQPEKVLVLDPKIARTHSTFYAQNLAQAEPAKEEEKPGINQQMTAAIKYTTAGYGASGLPAAPEKDLIEDPKIARRSTTFYAQLEGDDKKEEPLGINQQMTKAIKYTTAGYGASGLPAAPEKDLIEDPKIARRSTTFYAQL